MGCHQIKDPRPVGGEHQWGRGIDLPDVSYDVCLRCGLVRRERGGVMEYGWANTWSEKEEPCRLWTS